MYKKVRSMASKSKVLLVGSGGVGTMAAYALELSGRAEVTSVLRSDYDKVVKDGFTIDSCDYGHIEGFRTTNIVKSVESAKQYGPFEYLVLVTKCVPDITNMVEVVAPAVTKETTIVLLQNGLGIEADFEAAFPENIALSGVSMIGSANRGSSIFHEVSDFLKVGVFYKPEISKELQDEVCKKFVDIYDNDKIECIFDPDVKFSRWRKLVYNACLNPLCALLELDVGRLEIFGATDSIVRASMREVLAIAKSEGVDLPEDIMEFMIRSDDPHYYKPSMQVDVEKGNYIENEVILGNPVRIAKKNGVAAPILSLMYELLKVVQCKIKEKKGSIVVPKDRPVPASE